MTADIQGIMWPEARQAFAKDVAAASGYADLSSDSKLWLRLMEGELKATSV